MRKVRSVIRFYLFTYLIAGFTIIVIFNILRLFGILKIKGQENFPRQKGRILLVSNHPSLLEPILLVGLFIKQFVFAPWTYAPRIFADSRNYSKKWWAFIIDPILIPVDRANERGDSACLRTAVDFLRSGSNVMIFPEGGRTKTGKVHLTSKTGKKLRPLKGGIAIMAPEPGVLLVPVWFEYKGRIGMRINIGEPMLLEDAPREEVLERTTQALLDLADTSD